MPFDLFSELIPLRLHDHHDLSYTLKPTNPAAADPDVMLRRAIDLRSKLESSARTGHFYTTDKNKKTTPEKLELIKFDPKARKHVTYKETKLK